MREGQEGEAENAREAEQELASVARRVNAWVVVEVGVPVIWPVAGFSVAQGGRLPLVMLNV